MKLESLHIDTLTKEGISDMLKRDKATSQGHFRRAADVSAKCLECNVFLLPYRRLPAGVGPSPRGQWVLHSSAMPCQCWCREDRKSRTLCSTQTVIIQSEHRSGKNLVELLCRECCCFLSTSSGPRRSSAVGFNDTFNDNRMF